MKVSRFQTILDAYGASPDRWPEAERAEALILSRSSIAAARALAQARSLDEALGESHFETVTVQPGLTSFLHTRIVAAARPVVSSRIGRWLGFDITLAQLLPSAAGLAFAMLLGFAVGLGGLLELRSEMGSDDVTAVITPADAFLAEAGQ